MSFNENVENEFLTAARNGDTLVVQELLTKGLKDVINLKGKFI